MQFVILGLLISFGPRSLYDLRKQFEAGIALFYSASTGSLKHALDALVARGAIESSPVPGDARAKREYRVTETGRVEFNSWINGSVDGGDLETSLLSRMFFFDLISASEQRAVLDRFIFRAQGELNSLEALAASLEEHDIPAELAGHYAHQRATLDYGISQFRSSIAWMKDKNSSLADAI